MREQRRGRRIAMAPDEVHAYLRAARTCRVGTVGADGGPHVSALWFVWDGAAMWLNSLVKSQRWVYLVRAPRVSVLVDGGVDFMELHGVELVGGPSWWARSPARPHPTRRWPSRSASSARSMWGGAFVADGRHAWLRVVPDKIVSWDFRKIGG